MATAKNKHRNIKSYYRNIPSATTTKYYVYPSNRSGKENIPADKYSATIDKITLVTSNQGNPSWNIFYTLHTKDGNEYYAKQVIAEDTPYMNDFINFLDNAGVDTSVAPESFSGDVGTIYVTYPDNSNNFGTLVYSEPVVINHSPKKVSSMQELLAEDDEVEVEPDENEDEVEADDLEEEDIEEYLEEEE